MNNNHLQPQDLHLNLADEDAHDWIDMLVYVQFENGQYM